nr:AlkA N-terminal domain-containing protein [Terrimesophilobacter mesophilus]
MTAAPFDGRGVMRYLAGHAVPGVEAGDGEHYRRDIRTPGGPARLDVRLDGSDAVLATLDGGAIPEELVPRVRMLFDLDADSAAIDAHLASDPALEAAVAARPGIRLPGSLDLHEQVLRTMIGQQISIAAARTVLGRLALQLDGTGMFPTALQFAERGLEVLRGPATRVAAIHGVAIALASGELAIDNLISPAQLTERLVALPGIGAWTAGYVAMRGLGAQDILLSTDLVLLKGAAVLGLPGTSRGIVERAAVWSPYRSYANLHLWRATQAPE